MSVQVRSRVTPFTGFDFQVQCCLYLVLLCLALPLSMASSIHYFMRPVSPYDLPTLSFFDDQQVYPLVPRSSLFPLAAISLAIHFGDLISSVLSSVILFRVFQDRSRPLASLRYRLIDTTTSTQETTINASSIFQEQAQRSITRLLGNPGHTIPSLL